MKKVFKIILKVIVVILILIILFFFVNFIIHKYKLNKEYKELKEAGYIDKYSAGNYDLNIYRIGNKNSKHKLIGISGLGVNDYNIEMALVNDKLIDDYELIYIDRAGYGYSDDTKQKQTVQQVVSDYRTALKNAGIEGPYILMPHSLGGMYATYWESEYPDEIEGVILIDCSELGIDVWDEDYSVDFGDYFDLFLSKFGLQRYVLRNYVYELPNIYPKEYQKYADYLNIHSITGYAMLSEIKEMNNNTNYVFENIISNDIPKVYISTSNGARTKEEVKELFNWRFNRQKEVGLKVGKMPTDEKIEEIIEQFIEWENDKIIPYISKLGNTEIVHLPADHMVFEQKPDELADEIIKFINQVEKEEEAKNYKDDNPIVVGLYENDQNLITKYYTAKQNEKDLVFSVYYTNDKVLESRNQKYNFKKYYNAYENVEKYKIGFQVSFYAGDEYIDKTILGPEAMYYMDPYMYVYLYDDIHALDNTFYSHVEENQVTDSTIFSSIKLYLVEADKITSNVNVEVFTYDTLDDFDSEGHYRGDSKYQMEIVWN